MAAEAQVRLAAAGQVSTGNLGPNMDALRFMLGQMEKVQKPAANPAGKVNPNDLNGFQKAMRATVETMKDAGAKVLPQLKTALVSFGVAAAATTVGLRKFASAASPGLFQALNTSFDILTAKVGGALLPVIDAAIDLLQDASEWWDTLGDGTKKFIAGSIVAVPVLAALARAVVALGPAAAAAGGAVKGLSVAMAASPLLAGVGIGAAVIGGGYAFYQMLQQHEQEQYNRLHDQSARTGKVNSAELREANNLRTGFISDSDHKTNDELAAMTEAQRKQYYTQRAAYLRERSGSFFLTEGEKHQHEANAMIFERAAKEGAEAPGEEDWRKKIRRQAARVNAVTREGVAHYSPISDARKQLQLSMLNKNTFEQQLLREQRKHREEEIKRLDELIKQGKNKGYTIVGD